MDRRDAMALPGSASYYVQQRGMTSSSGAGTTHNLHGSPGIHTLSTPNVQFQSNIGGTTLGSTLPVESSSAISPHGVNVAAPSGLPQIEPAKRKRGRPRKYGPDGTVSLALSPSVSTNPGTLRPTQKRGRGRPPGTGRKQQLASLGEWLSGSAGMGFTPHIITVAVGEDIAMKIMSFSQQGPRAICVLSANGAVSTATLRQPSTSGGTVTYEGRFEILCLSGSYLVTSSGGPRNRSGGLSVSLASSDGRIIGGGVGGMLIAASTVQVIVGSFLWGGPKTKSKKGEIPEGVRDLEHQTIDNPVTLTSAPSSHNLTPTSSVGVWPGSRPMDMHNPHADIDLMRG
ncbi:AT-hook motif nuclear-localized protein 11 [Mangifera indica]|uniref:AT-hook motif nuclear-localized protein 11 n=1 Tax=Mangifera indica TaxID=29780 RepID=UPI001CFAF46C|nr:AT-hook motif nuclear-localized protein 11 [Mangifera indica]XP_044494120.1 AT-hook motif nuclear-localized protein 11 [Mangifera indica]XP_044494122.1 AT-hook motif nuclear-localized protein 11 [Mangifera indica]XP_044494123.1 AT-hook motif nuclear-localized protein 11 [Mangifera indica]